MVEGSGESIPRIEEAQEKLGELLTETVKSSNRNKAFLNILSIPLILDILLSLILGYTILQVRIYQHDTCQNFNAIKQSWANVLKGTPRTTDPVREAVRAQFEQDLNRYSQKC